MPYQDIKLQVLRTHSDPISEDAGEVIGLGVEDDTHHHESDHLILASKYTLRNPWGLFLRVLLIMFLFASLLAVLSVVGKEWYILSHPMAFNTNLLDPESPENKCSIDRSWRFDCHPEPDATEAKCSARSCCWVQGDPKSGEPFCYFSRVQFTYGYYNWSSPINTTFGQSAEAILTTPSSYPRDVKKLMVNVYHESEDTVRIKIYDPSVQRFEVPLDYKTSEKKSPNVNYTVKFYSNGIRVHRAGMSFPLFDTTIAPMIYANQFLQISTQLPSEYIYGLGEVDDTLRRNLNWKRSVLWTHDRIPGEDSNLYGAHPFYMVMEQSGLSHGVFLANSNAMEVILQPAPALTFRTIGGILDIRVFVGPKPSDVMKQYTDVIGKPMLPPYFSLGFHLCRFNYGTLNHTQEILENNLKAGIPIDVQWNDLDYMKNQNDFTFDKEKFSGLPEFVKKLHERGMYYIPLIDAGISGGESAGSYAPYDDGMSQNIFITDGVTGKPFVGKVWNPNSTLWPDFSHPNVTHYWMWQFQKFYDSVPIDGAWIDMNEPSNFWDGTQDGKCHLDSELDYPPYVPRVDGGKLHYKTICPSAKQYLGSHYDLHNLFGTLETKATYDALGDIRSKRAFVISRSTFPGQGKYGGHWTGDVVSSFEHMKKSVPQILNFGLFGIPMVGADICGFNGNTTVELCRRWQQLGAFYPFSRNHNTDDGIPQDPASLGKIVVDAAKETLTVRYSLLPYLYSVFFHAHVTGEPVARALFYEFSFDPKSYLVETQFMLGPAIMIIPILEENYKAATIKAYLPPGWWYQHYYPIIIESLGEVRDIRIPEEFNSIPILYRAGTIIVKQIPGRNTKESRSNSFTIHAFLSNGNATGELYWDDGETPLPDVLTNYNHYNLNVEHNSLSMIPDKTGYPEANLTASFIEIRGIKGIVSAVTINNVDWDTFSFDVQKLTLSVNTTRQKLSLTDGITLVWNSAKS